MSQKVGIVGTGYVGLVSGICFAATGNTVYCTDILPEKINKLQHGRSTIFEPGLDALLKQVMQDETIKFTHSLEEVIESASIIFLCLPTPPNEDGSADLNHVLNCTRDIAEIIKNKDIRSRKILVNKSTVPVGTAEKSRAILDEIIPGFDIEVVSNPEFLREGFAVEDSMRPERIVVGTRSAWVEEFMRDLYLPFVRNGNPIYFMDEKSAEVTKYAANSFLATKISYMNELSRYCEAVGVDIENVRIGIGSDSRVGKRFLFAGVGYGGSCFPKDVRALMFSAKKAGTPLTIIESAYNANMNQIDRFADRIVKRFGADLRGKKFAIWGLAFKPNTDDTREAPAFRIIDAILAAGGTVSAFDPEAMDNTKHRYGSRIDFAKGKYDCLNGAEALVIVTEWNTFRNPDFDELANRLANKIIFDGRNLFEYKQMLDLGYEYYPIGRRFVNSKL